MLTLDPYLQALASHLAQQSRSALSHFVSPSINLFWSPTFSHCTPLVGSARIRTGLIFAVFASLDAVVTTGLTTRTRLSLYRFEEIVSVEVGHTACVLDCEAALRYIIPATTIRHIIVFFIFIIFISLSTLA
jgi:hypothetical protein